MNREDIETRYKKWWEMRYCRNAGQDHQPFKLVKKVTFFAPPSGVYGGVELTYADGTKENVFQGSTFKPRKSDVEVEQDELK